MIIDCPPYAHAVAEPNSKWGTIEWREPRVIDNADKESEIELIKSGDMIAPGNRIEVGTYKVNYNARDKAGNKAKQCKVELSMKGVSEYSK